MRRIGGLIVAGGLVVVLVIVASVVFAKLEYVRPGFVGV